MMEKHYRIIEDNTRRIFDEIADTAAKCERDPLDIGLMAVTKTRTPEEVNAAIGCGITLLGENRAQELNEKYGSYRLEHAAIHFIGHLQTNKVRQIVDKVTMIHSVDSERLAREINRKCKKMETEMDILIEVNVGGELSKSGTAPEQIEELLCQCAALPCVHVRGLMTVPPICEKEADAERYFARMYELLVDMRAKKIDNVAMDVLSMGMSDDYHAAIRQGATILRLGSAIFGPRVY